jgi:hypothetical protein
MGTSQTQEPGWSTHEPGSLGKTWSGHTPSPEPRTSTPGQIPHRTQSQVLEPSRVHSVPAQAGGGAVSGMGILDAGHALLLDLG